MRDLGCALAEAREMGRRKKMWRGGKAMGSAPGIAIDHQDDDLEYADTDHDDTSGDPDFPEHHIDGVGDVPDPMPAVVDFYQALKRRQRRFGDGG